MFGLERSRVPASEDCLYLNVWAPLTAAKEAKLPVFVWIYGGAYHMERVKNLSNATGAAARMQQTVQSLNPAQVKDIATYLNQMK